MTDRARRQGEPGALRVGRHAGRPVRLPAGLVSLEGWPGWLAALAAAGYILAATVYWRVPDPTGIPFWLLWIPLAGLGLAGLVVARRGQPAEGALTRRHLRPVEALAVGAVSAMLLTDAAAGQPLRDLGIYLHAGEHFLAGQPVYLSGLIRAVPTDRTLYPFLYPPFSLPFFALLVRLPYALAALLWTAANVAGALVALRLVGLPWRWALGALAWPPFWSGIYVGNVAVLSFLLFAVGPWLGGTLVVGAAFKLYSGLAALWLVRPARWRAIVAGVGILLGLVVVSLPFVGLGLWADWVQGLRFYQASQPLLPEYLYGLGLGRYLPLAAVVVVALAALAMAVLARGREGLARLGVATIAASPSAFGHGFLMAVPALLTLRTGWLWLGLAVTSVAPGLAWWLVPLAIAAGWFLPPIRHAAEAPDPLHPLGRATGPWPDGALPTD